MLRWTFLLRSLAVPPLPVLFVCECVCLQEVRLFRVEEELALKEARWLQSEAELQSMVASLEMELELEREQHSKEVQQLLKLQDWCRLPPSNASNQPIKYRDD